MADLHNIEKLVTEMFADMQEDLIRRMSKRIAKMDFTVSESTLYEMERAIGAGATYDDVTKAIAKACNKAKSDIDSAFDNADWDTYLKQQAPQTIVTSAGITYGIENIIRANAEKLTKHLVNLTGTTANRSQEDFIKACNTAYSEVVSGAVSADSAVTYAIKDLAKGGVKVQYPSGHIDTVDVAAKRAVRTSVSQTNGDITKTWLKDNDWDIVETSAHAGARLRHIPWQGRRFSFSGRDDRYPDFESETEYGDPLGIKGYNCRHEFFPAYEFMPTAYTDEQLRDMADATVTYDGKEIPLRDANTIQRGMERKIRATKRELIGLDELKKAQPENLACRADYARRSKSLKRQRDHLADFLDQTGLKKSGSNEQVYGFGRSATVNATNAAKNELTGKSKRGIIQVNSTKSQATPYSITERIGKGGGIDRNFYGVDGKQTKQISNYGHGHKVEEAMGNHGEHAHDYIWSDAGKLTRGDAREITDSERKEQGDFL